MVVVLNDGAKLEMRAVPRFRELEAFIEEQRESRGKGAARTSGATGAAGFAPPVRESA
jgi:hypothetical protein